MGNEYVEDSLCFTGSVADQLYKSGILSEGVIEIGSTRKLLPIFELTANPSRSSQVKANLALQKLLIDCYLKRDETTLYDNYPRMSALIDQIQQNPGKWWSTSEMADYTNLSENQHQGYI